MFIVTKNDDLSYKIVFNVDQEKVRRLNSISLMDWKFITPFKKIVESFADRLDSGQIDSLLHLWLYNQNRENLLLLIESVLSDGIPEFKY